MYDTIDNTDKKDDTGTKGYEIDKKWKDIGKKKGESDLQMNQSGARYGHVRDLSRSPEYIFPIQMSGASHREYHSIEDIEKMEKEAAKKKGVYGVCIIQGGAYRNIDQLRKHSIWKHAIKVEPDTEW